MTTTLSLCVAAASRETPDDLVGAAVCVPCAAINQWPPLRRLPRYVPVGWLQCYPHDGRGRRLLQRLSHTGSSLAVYSCPVSLRKPSNPFSFQQQKDELRAIAEKIVADGKGILAADESTGM